MGDQEPDPATAPPKRLVLVGGGHAHLFVLKAFADAPEPGVHLTLVTRDRFTPYSGMLPGHVAGLYGRSEMHIDLARLAGRSGARMITEDAVALDPEARRLRLKSGAEVPYDILSVDIGITPDLDAIPGARAHALAVKPIGDFLAKWDRLRARILTPEGPRRIAVIGGGVAGICLVLAVAAALRRAAGGAGLGPEAFRFTLVSAAPPAELNSGMRRRVLRALSERAIEVSPGEPAAAIDATGITLRNGTRIASDAVLVSTQAVPPPLVRDTDLATDARGFLAIRPTLQALGRDEVFAAGDCATLIADPRPKAGVFAVRQGPVLARNLRRALRGEALEEHRPQKSWLVLIGTGDGEAIGGRGRLIAFGGRFAWRLKDAIDRRFMRRFG